MPPDISIRRYQATDVDPIYQAVLESRKELAPWAQWCHENYSREDTLAWVESREAAWEQNNEWHFVIVDSEGEVLGSCGIHHVDLNNRVGELGYWIRSSRTNQGVATAAGAKLCQWAFDEDRLDRIGIVVATLNRGSQRVAEKLGAAKEGTLRQRLLLHGQRLDCFLYSILRCEWT